MSDANPQTTELTAEDLKRLAKQRTFIEQYLGDEASREKYKTAAGKLGLLRALLNANVFKTHQTWELQSMGVVLGDAFVQEPGLRWVIVQDEYGRDPVLAVPGKTVLIYPLTTSGFRVAKDRARCSCPRPAGQQARRLLPLIL